MEYFSNSDLDTNYSLWKSEAKDIFFLFPPLKFDRKLQGLQSKSNSEKTRIDFKLIIKKDIVFFEDLINKKSHIFDISEITNGKIAFSNEKSLKNHWIRQPLENSPF